MSEIRELSFCELRQKDIVNICDGRKLGRIIDLVFSPSGKVQGIVAPYGRKILFFRSQEVYIPFTNIKTIGEDIILVDISSGLDQRHYKNESQHHFSGEGAASGEKEKQCKHHPRYEEPKGGDCDGRCDKCMLFDCENRWKIRNDVYVDNEPYK